MYIYIYVIIYVYIHMERDVCVYACLYTVAIELLRRLMPNFHPMLRPPSLGLGADMLADE